MDHLIEENMGLVNVVVNRFQPKTYHERDELTQAGRIGLWKALKKFDVKKGCKLSPYAWNPIKWEILKEIRFLKKTEALQKIPIELVIKQQKTGLWEILPDFLSDNEKKIICLRTEGYKLHEICQHMEISKSKVKQIAYTAIRKIRESNP